MGRAVGRPKTTSKFLLFYRCRKQIHHCNGPNGDRFTTRLLIFFPNGRQSNFPAKDKLEWETQNAHSFATTFPFWLSSFLLCPREATWFLLFIRGQPGAAVTQFTQQLSGYPLESYKRRDRRPPFADSTVVVFSQRRIRIVAVAEYEAFCFLLLVLVFLLLSRT